MTDDPIENLMPMVEPPCMAQKKARKDETDETDRNDVPVGSL
jgi:hypothetical protein